MGLLIFGMAAVGMQVRGGLDIARTVNTGTRALMLVDTIWAELDAGVIRPGPNDDEIKGDFGVGYPGYSWRIDIEPCDIDDFYMLTMELGYNTEAAERQIDDPSYEIDIEDEGTRIVRTVYRLYPRPADINIERDFGVTQEDLTNLMGTGDQGGGQQGGPTGDGSGDQGGGGTGELGGLAALAEQMGIDLTSFDFLFDPNGFDPRMLTELPPEDFAQLAELMETLLRQGGGALSNLQNQMGGDNLRNLIGEGRRRAEERRQGGEDGGEDAGSEFGEGRQVGRDRGEESGEAESQGNRSERSRDRREGLTRQRGRDRESGDDQGGSRGRDDRATDGGSGDTGRPSDRDTRRQDDRRSGRDSRTGDDRGNGRDVQDDQGRNDSRRDSQEGQQDRRSGRSRR